MKKIKWGIMGIGRIAEKFAHDLKTVENAELFAVASTSIGRAQEFALKHNARFAFGSYTELVQISDLDVVYIATPHPLHAVCTNLCLEHKIAVLCEKPFAMNEGEVNQMLDLAKKQKTFLMEAMWTRFLPTTLKTIELIEQGAIGAIKTLHADFGFKAAFEPEKRLYNKQLGGGALLDIGIYPAFLSLLLLGYPTAIQALSVFAATGVDETTSFILSYENQATAVLNCTITTNTNCMAIIYGTKGRIEIGSRFHESEKVTLFVENEPPVDFEYPRSTFGYDFEAREVNECLINGQLESKQMSHSMSRKLIHLLDKIREKAGIMY